MMGSWLSRWRWGMPRAAVRRVRPRVEALEDRRVPAVFNPLPNIPDGAPGSLRADIIASNLDGQDNTLILSPGHYLLTLPNTAGQENAGATGDLDITAVGHTITIEGAGADVTVVDAGGIDRVFQILTTVNVIFRNLTITVGRAVDNGAAGATSSSTQAEGGGILIGPGYSLIDNTISTGSVTLDHVLVEGNMAVGGTDMRGDGQAAIGGGIVTDGTLIIIDSTIANNEAIGGNGGATSAFNQGQGGGGGEALGGGLLAEGALTMIATSVEANEALGGDGGNGPDGTSGNPVGQNGGGGGLASGGGLFFGGGLFTCMSSTFAGNFAGGGAGGNGGLGMPGGDGGNGGAGGAASGGGMVINQPSPSIEAAGAGDLTSLVCCIQFPPPPNNILFDSTIADNSVAGGYGGLGGNGSDVPGNGGSGDSAQGGGIVEEATASLTIDNSTVAFNRAKGGHGAIGGTGKFASVQGSDGSGDEGGVYSNGLMNAVSSIFGDNTAQGGAHPDFFGQFTTASHILVGNDSGSDPLGGSLIGNSNLFGTTANPLDPKLRPLDFYGGPTRTVALYGDSPAIDAGINPNGLTTDQRGFGPRAVNGATDIGAFEFGALPVVASPSPPPPTSVPVAVAPAFTPRLVRVHHRTRLDVFDAATGQLRLRVFPFGASHGKVQLLTGDANHDGVADIIVLDMERHHQRKRVFSGTDLSDLTALIS
jgi:hypothetical protein